MTCPTCQSTYEGDATTECPTCSTLRRILARSLENRRRYREQKVKDDRTQVRLPYVDEDRDDT